MDAKYHQSADREIACRPLYAGTERSRQVSTRQLSLWKENKSEKVWEQFAADSHLEESGPIQWTTAKIQYHARVNMWMSIQHWTRKILGKKRLTIQYTPSGEKVAALKADIPDAFIAWSANPAQALADLIHDDILACAHINEFGKTIAAVGKVHPVLLDAPVPAADPAGRARLEKKMPAIRDRLSHAGSRIIGEYFPEDWDRMTVCFRHLHGTADALDLIGHDFFSSSAFIEHQVNTHDAARSIAELYGWPRVQAFMETFPARGTEDHPEVEVSVKEFEFAELCASNASGVRILQDLFENRKGKGSLESELPPVDAGRRIAGGMIKAGMGSQVFGDGRLENGMSREKKESLFSVPHRTLTRRINEHVLPGNLGILIYGGGHFRGNDRYTMRPPCGFLEEYLSHIPRHGYMIVESEFDTIRSKVLQYASRLLTSQR